MFKIIYYNNQNHKHLGIHHISNFPCLMSFKDWRLFFLHESTLTPVQQSTIVSIFCACLQYYFWKVSNEQLGIKNFKYSASILVWNFRQVSSIDHRAKHFRIKNCTITSNILTKNARESTSIIFLRFYNPLLFITAVMNYRT